LVVAAAEGWNLRAKREPSSADGSSQPLPPPLGMHGYDPRLPSMQSILIGHGPGLASRTKVGPVENIHLYELMCRLLAIEPARNDGRLSAVKRLLARSPVEQLMKAARPTTSR
jgi:predicted AlkP superfamily pyrophosphatase or phosphodiesterase